MMNQPPDKYKTQDWHQLKDGRVVCDLCPRHCRLRDGKRGACFIRRAENGEIVLTSYGQSSGLCIDPIEKKPLNHFYPGSSVLSLGTAGCNLACRFCQNWEISKSRQTDTLSTNAMPEHIARTALQYGCKSIAFTYNDPVIFMEYAIDTAQAGHAFNIQSVAVTAGYICQQPRIRFFDAMDAANVDLKAFSEPFYRKLCQGHLAPVLDTLLYLHHETQVWLEITTLLIPGENDSVQELDAMTQWIYDYLGPDIPLHFSAFHPDFKMTDKPNTPVETVRKARQIALNNGLHYVYTGNIADDSAGSSWCPQCKRQIILRHGYQTENIALADDGKCRFCGFQIAGRFSAFDRNAHRQYIPFRRLPE